MLKLISRINVAPLALAFCLLAMTCWFGFGTAALAQPPAQQQTRYCTWLFWSKDPALIKKALERLAQGEPFMVVARDLARKNPKTSQANADCMIASGMDPAVLAIVSRLQIGQIGRPFDLGGGTALVMRTTDEHRRRAQELYAKGRFGQAERELLRDLKLHPASAAAWHMLALTRTAQGHYKSALAALDKALTWSPDNPAMLNDKASALANLGRAKDAIPVFKKALKLDPKNPTIMSNLAWALTLAHKNPKRAEALAKQACQEAPKEARFWHTLGKVQAGQGRHGEAVASLRQALILAPKMDAAGKDLIISIKALDPKMLARLDHPQAAQPPTSKPEAKATEEPIAKGLKPAPDLAAPALRLPSQWPVLPSTPTAEKPGAQAAAKEKGEAKAEAKEEPKAAAPAPPSSGASGRIVSLPMPKFPETPPARAEDDKQAEEIKTEAQQKPADQSTSEVKPEPTPADAAKEQAKAESKAEAPKPSAAAPAAPAETETKPTSAKIDTKTKPAEAEAKAEAKGAQPAAKPDDTPAPDKADQKVEKPKTEPPALKAAAKPEAEKTVSAKADPKQEADKIAPAEPAAQKPAQAAAAQPDKPYFLIQVASFRPETLAQKELRIWKKRGQAALIEKWQDKRGRAWHRVFLGPFANKKEAESKATDLKKKKLLRDYYVVKRPSD